MNIDNVPMQPKVARQRRKRSAYPLRFTRGMFNTPIFRRERNDCTVRSLAIAAEIGYDDAHHIMQTQAGRKDRQGSNISRISANIMWGDGKGTVISGYRVKWHSCEKDYSGHRIKGTTVRQLIASGTLPKRCIIAISGHVMACIDNIVYDSFNAGARSIVNGYYSFEKESEIKHEQHCCSCFTNNETRGWIPEPEWLLALTSHQINTTQ